jgi:hypothetical protein
VSDRRWFRPKLLANYTSEYSAETEYSASATDTKSQKSAFLFLALKKVLKKRRLIVVFPGDPKCVLVTALLIVFQHEKLFKSGKTETIVKFCPNSTNFAVCM